jgi:hypothetical protein
MWRLRSLMNVAPAIATLAGALVASIGALRMNAVAATGR